MKINAIASLAILLWITLLMGACQNDEQVGSVIGRWEGTKISASFKPDGIPASIDQDDDTFNAIIEFKADGSVIYADDGDEYDGTWVQNGNTLTLTVNADLTFFDLSGTGTIEEATAEKLTLYLERKGEFDIPDFGALNGTVKARIYFQRIP
ncbi:MAG: hypothetical protein JNM57_16400 [Cyclobacteriaceae bacterium]|nr:hypothetical protein [Cyclobacteriaceae bacterium]